MLSVQDRAIIKSTVPLLESGGEGLITHFYRMMLSEYPEVRSLFNQANQASGDQPRALANGVLMYARHIDQLDQLGDLVAKIINKHVALQILPEHYPIVGSCLLRAIREVLGTKSPPRSDERVGRSLMVSWPTSSSVPKAPSTTKKPRPLAAGAGACVSAAVKRVEESSEITSLYFAPVDNGPILAAEPGQYIGLKMMIDGEEVRRNYSLSALAPMRAVPDQRQA
jgi:nitric oxide dioxygenase